MVGWADQALAEFLLEARGLARCFPHSSTMGRKARPHIQGQDIHRLREVKTFGAPETNPKYN